MAKILVADDDVELADALRRLLTYDGHTVSVAHDGAAAIETMRSSDFEIVITDIVMPENGGVVVSGMARMLQKSATVIAISGYLDQAAGAIKSQFLGNLGVSHVLKKPLDLDELSRLVLRIVGED